MIGCVVWPNDWCQKPRSLHVISCARFLEPYQSLLPHVDDLLEYSQHTTGLSQDLSKLGQSGLGSEHCIVWLTPALHSPSSNLRHCCAVYRVYRSCIIFRSGFISGICVETSSGSAVVIMPGSEMQGHRISSPLNLSNTPTRLTNGIASHVCA